MFWDGSRWVRTNSNWMGSQAWSFSLRPSSTSHWDEATVIKHLRQNESTVPSALLRWTKGWDINTTPYSRLRQFLGSCVCLFSHEILIGCPGASTCFRFDEKKALLIQTANQYPCGAFPAIWPRPIAPNSSTSSARLSVRSNKTQRRFRPAPIQPGSKPSWCAALQAWSGTTKTLPLHPIRVYCDSGAVKTSSASVWALAI